MDLNPTAFHETVRSPRTHIRDRPPDVKARLPHP